MTKTNLISYFNLQTENRDYILNFPIYLNIKGTLTLFPWKKKIK